MFIVRNSTRYQAQAAVLTDQVGREAVVVVAKATFGISPTGAAELASEQVPLILADEYLGDPASTSLKAPSDFALYKPRADVVVVGAACAPDGEKVRQLDVELNVGSMKKKLRVFGNRRWEQKLLKLVASEPEPFDRMPLSYELAFGGRCPAAEDQGSDQQLDSNPIGRGFWSTPEHASDKPLPNLENPAALISAWNDRPEPCAFGYVCGHWQPRRSFAGTYNEAWEQDRLPLLPLDFDERFFNVAPLDQQLEEYLAGGEEVRLNGCSPEGEIRFEVPRDEVGVNLLFPMEIERRESARLDTLIIEPDLRRIQLVWRVTFPAPDPITHLLHLDVTSRMYPVHHPHTWPEQDQDEEPYDDE